MFNFKDMVFAFCLVFLALSVVSASPIDVDSCGVLNQSFENYYLVQNLSSSGTCFTIEGDGITLYGQGHTITGDGDFFDSGVYVSGKDSVSIENLVIENFGNGVFLGSVDGFLLKDSILLYNEKGLFSLGSDNGVIWGNHFSRNQDGLVLSFSDDNLLLQNVLLYNYQNAIVVDSSSHSTISDGFVLGTGDNALLLTGETSQDTLISRLNVSGSGSYDIYSTQGVDDTRIEDTAFGAFYFEGPNLFDGSGGKVSFRDSSFGEVEFLEGVSGSGADLSNVLIIRDNLVSLKSFANPGFNRKANVTLYGIGDRGFIDPAIFRNLGVCPSSICTAFTSLTAQTVKFGVESWENPITSYKIGEGYKKTGMISRSLRVASRVPAFKGPDYLDSIRR